MDISLWETAKALPWWAFVLAGMGGIGFGAFQVWLLMRAIGTSRPRYGLIVIKLLLWSMALVGMGFISIPLLLLFVACASFTLLAGCMAVYQKAKQEGQ